METHLPSPMAARVYVNLLEGRWYNDWLVVWNMNFMTFRILGIMIPNDELIFSEGQAYHQPEIDGTMILIDFDWFSNGTIIDGTITLLIFNDWFRFWLILRLDFQWSDMIMNMYECVYLGCHGDKNIFKMTWLLYGAFQDVPHFLAYWGWSNGRFFIVFLNMEKTIRWTRAEFLVDVPKHGFPIVFP